MDRNVRDLVSTLRRRYLEEAASLLVTSASGANGNGYGALLAFDHDGEPLGPFSDDDRIVDPRGLAPEPEPGLLFLNSVDRVLALDQAGKVMISGNAFTKGELQDLEKQGAVG